MGKKIKKGQVGPVKEYVSRTKAIKKLQVNLKDFRRLCILKGIYPRDPPKKLKKQNKTYYHVKDVAFLKSESILNKLRERRANLKRIRKALIRGDRLKARRMRINAPKENIPNLLMHLNDLDDPLSLISLFASFPTHKELHIPNSLIMKLLKADKLIFDLCCIKQLFEESIYYQAIVHGSTITWIMPYPIQASLPLDVDYRVMMTFLEFYQILLRFVNFKLLGQELDVSDVGDLVREFNRNKNNEIMEVDEKFKDDPAYQQINEQNEEIKRYKNLFKGYTFYLYPEVPKQSLEFVILSFGGDVRWSGDSRNSTEKDSSITHVVLERPIPNKDKKREYIQPQWVYDCINNGSIISVQQYGPDQVLPPHLSPFEEQIIDVEDVQSEEDVKLKIPQNKARKEEKKKQQEQKELDDLASTMLTKKNLKLKNMIKRKEQEKREQKQKLINKRKELQQ
ncbi:hypothetical protein pb186bvf_015415 [Paramecium bursaria]